MAMRAIIGCVGREWMLREQELPLIRLGPVRGCVVAAGLNRADLLMLDGKYGLNSKINDLYGAGMELAGIVETSSPLSPHLPVGARVMGVTQGAFVDYALGHPGTLIPIPDNVCDSKTQ